jgi:hypothetical protein
VKRWPEIRAGVLALVIFFGLVEGCPLPPPGKTLAWQTGYVEPIRSVQRVVLAPIAWIGPKLRISQRWAVYQAPSRDRFRLWIEGQDARGRWQLLFRAGDDAYQHDGELIDYSRPRGVWDPTSVPPGQYTPFARWMTWRILEQHPDWVAARIRLEKVRITDNSVEPTGQFVHVHMRTRGGPP